MPDAAPILSDSPVFLLGSHKSGTSLLRALLDGHRDLHVLPRETHFFPNSGHWVHYGLKRQRPADDEAETRQRFADHVARRAVGVAEPGDQFSDAPDFAGYDKAVFAANFDFDAGSPRRRFESYLNALQLAHGGGPLPAGARFVEKSVENAEFAEDAADLFPAARFVHIVRNPYATLVAIRRARATAGGRYPEMQPVIDALFNSHYFLYRNQRRLGDAYLAIRYEDVLTDPAATMRRVADHLRIDFSDDLTKPTSGGRPWGGNSTAGGSFEGISTKPITAWKKHVLGYEIALVNHWLGHVLQRFDYAREASPNRAAGWKRLLGRDGAPRESAATFARNRALLHMQWPGAQ